MIVRRLIVFSGFDGRVVEKIRPRLASQQADVVIVKRPNIFDELYFRKLLQRFWTVSQPYLVDENVRLVSVLASCLSGPEEANRERQVFWPILRRVVLDKRCGSDVNMAGLVSEKIIQLLAHDDFLGTYKRIRPATDATLSLPVENISTPRFRTELDRLYDLETFQPAPALDRYVQKLKRGAGLRVRGLDFKGCVNNASHPVRRITDSVRCDLEARMRLGFSVPSRFEFDVTCATGLAGKTFKLCSGMLVKIPASADHLNMRMNGDFDHP
jgi:hypothetical protein